MARTPKHDGQDEEDERELELNRLRAEQRAAHFAHVRSESRLSLPYALRLPLAGVVSFIAGMSLGVGHGSQMAAFRFRAENAHRLPTTTHGWYLYHKSKNYNTALGGLKEGFKMGLKISFWTLGFFYVEDLWDEIRGTQDFLNTVVASSTVAGAFSLWNRFPITTAARTAKTALAVGLAFGLAQDAVGVMRGRRPGYVEFVLRKARGKDSGEQSQAAPL